MTTQETRQLKDLNKKELYEILLRYIKAYKKLEKFYLKNI